MTAKILLLDELLWCGPMVRNVCAMRNWRNARDWFNLFYVRSADFCPQVFILCAFIVRNLRNCAHVCVKAKMSTIQQTNKKCGYCGYILPRHFDLFKHSCFNSFNKDTDCLNVDESLVVTIMTRIQEFNESNLPESNLPNDESNNSLQELDTDELLIYYVSQKRALFDHRIPASDRSTLKKNALWQEICNSLGGALSIIEAKKRWRYFRDCFLKAKKKEHTYIPSGSAAESLNCRKHSFRFYEQMKFLDDIFEKAPTCTSLPSNVQNDEDGENISAEAKGSSMLVSPLTGSNISSLLSSTSEESNFNSNRKRRADRWSKELNEEFHETVINALKETKQPDGVDGFLLLLGEGLRKLPYRERTKLEMKFLAMLMEEQDKLHNLSI